MKYLDTLKKERSKDRVIFLAGMVLAFIGFLVPTVYVKMVVAEPIDNTLEVSDDDEASQGSQMADDAFYESLINGTASTDDSSEDDVQINDEAVIVLKSTSTDFVRDKNDDKVLNRKGEPKKVTTTEYSYIQPYEVEAGQHVHNKLLNIFGLAAAFNVAPYAYNATFLVIVWLCSIAGIVLFFVTKTIVGDIVAVLVGLGFAIASAISVPLTLQVLPIVGYMTVGGYMVLVGWVVAIIGSVLGAAHIQHPGIRKEL